MWALRLNPMTDRAERVDIVAIADTREALERLLENESVPNYKDGGYSKNFRQGGPLEWFNPPLGGQAWIDVDAIIDVGTADQWAQRARDQFHEMERRYPKFY